MELIPYTSREGREIVLRHHNALVVRDPSSQRLEIRGLSLSLTECPTCHQPLRGRSSSPDRHGHFDNAPIRDETYVDPNYFRMLQAGHNQDHYAQQPPSSPIRRLTQPTLPIGDSRTPEVHDAEFISSTPVPQEGTRIRKNAFSPNYFKTFFIEERELGRGGKGVVLLVRHEIDGCPLGHFACKRVPVGDDHAWLEKVLIEVELLAKLSHPNLVSYRHVWLEDVKLHRFGPSVACAFILQQYCNGGDLLRYVVGELPRETTKEQLKAQMRRRSKGQIERPQGLSGSHRKLSFEEIYSLFKDIVSGLAYLHGSNYIHRDLKPSNCLLHQEGGKLTCLISDFGEVQPENAVRKSTGTTGTISYCAPEVLKQADGGRFGNFTTKSDVFSLGMILYFLCFSRLPYDHANSIQEELEDIDQLRSEIRDWKGFQDERRERPDLPSKLYQLLKKMLALDPSERPSATEVLTVMNHESNMGGPRREQRSSAPPLGLTSRIQNLDSPMPPSTPVPDPLKHHYGDAAVEEEHMSSDVSGVSDDLLDHLPQPASQSHSTSIQRHPSPTTPRHRPTTAMMTLSRSQDGHARPSADDAVAPNGVAWPQPSLPPPPPPLLLAPPGKAPGSVKYSITQHRLIYLYDRNAESIVFFSRLLMFLIKMASMVRLCWPFMVNPRVGAPIIILAAMDLGMPRRDSLGPSQEGGSRRPSSWRWDWRVSSMLFAMHFVALGAISKWGAALCAASHDYF